MLTEKVHSSNDGAICDFETIKIKYGSGNTRPPNINDKPVTLGAAFEKLTPEQIEALNERYDISTIKKDSTEYNMLMGELYELGVISNIPSTLPLNSQVMAHDADGLITEFFSKSEENGCDQNLYA